MDRDLLHGNRIVSERALRMNREFFIQSIHKPVPGVTIQAPYPVLNPQNRASKFFQQQGKPPLTLRAHLSNRETKQATPKQNDANQQTDKVPYQTVAPEHGETAQSIALDPNSRAEQGAAHKAAADQVSLQSRAVESRKMANRVTHQTN